MLIIALQVGVVFLMEHCLLVDDIDLNDALTYGRLKRLLIVSLIEEAGRQNLNAASLSTAISIKPTDLVAHVLTVVFRGV